MTITLLKKVFHPFLITQVPLHLQPVFKNLGYGIKDFPASEKVANQCLSLPMSPYLGEADQQMVINGILQL
jgi:dTDP-4-amino-4,6-dideoxygalactose transaminase